MASEDVQRIIQAIRKTGEEIHNEAYLVEGERERIATYEIGTAFQTLARRLETEFATDLSLTVEVRQDKADDQMEAHRDGRDCGWRPCRVCEGS